MGAGAVGVVVLGAAAIRPGIVAPEHVAGLGRHANGGHGSTIGRGHLSSTFGGGSLIVQCHGVSVDRPVCGI